MVKYTVREVCRRGKDHQNFCEDSSLVFQDEEYIHVAVFDGCSTGKDSHFASFFFSRMLRKTIKESLIAGNGESLTNKLMRVYESFYNNLRANKRFIDITTIEFLSTVVYAIIHKETNRFVAVIKGDGCVFNGGLKILDIDAPGNAPDYLAYYLERNDTFDTVWKNTSLIIGYIENELAVTTDGIKSFKKLKGNVDEQFVVDTLLIDRRFVNLEVMLERKCKVLENVEKMVHTDDLSIIRVILEPNEETK
jgi:hypothetical protein